MKQKKILIFFSIFFLFFVSIFAWSRFHVSKKVEADVEILRTTEKGQARIRDETETISIKVISQEKQEDKRILYLEDGTELFIPEFALISDEQGQVYESCNGMKVLINQEEVIVSKKKEEAKTSSEISRKENNGNENK